VNNFYLIRYLSPNKHLNDQELKLPAIGGIKVSGEGIKLPSIIPLAGKLKVNFFFFIIRKTNIYEK
jgi:hypothetical protein